MFRKLKIDLLFFLKKNIVYVSNRTEYSLLFEFYKKHSFFKNALFYCPNKLKIKKIIDYFKSRKIDISNKIIPYSTVSFEDDEIIYEMSKKIARVIYEGILESSISGYSEKHYFLDQDTKTAFIQNYVDRLASLIRPPIQFLSLLSRNKFHKKIFFGNNSSSDLINLDIIQKMMGEKFNLTYLNGIRILKQKKLNFSNLNLSGEFDIYEFNPLDINYPNVACVVNLSDNQHLNTILPIIKKLLDKINVCLFDTSASKNNNNTINQKELGENKYKLFIVKKTSTTKRIKFDHNSSKFLHSCLQYIYCALKNSGYPSCFFAKIIIQYLAIHLIPSLNYIKHTKQIAFSALQSTKATVVLPGRTVDANIFAACASQKSIPSIEIQSGIISTNPRFFKPISDEILAIDSVSKKIYTDFLGCNKNSVIVTGGAKIDHDLYNYRQLGKYEARTKIPELSDRFDSKIIMLATQPLEIKILKCIITICIEACKLIPDLVLVVKPHPNEQSENLALYMHLARRLGFDKMIIIQNANTFDVVVASDVIATYFSTVGIQAYALRKEVICINPFKSRPPFDLVDLGIASEAANCIHLFELLRKSIGSKPLQLDQSKQNEYIRDGKAVERISNHILMKASLI
jgi:hypothetical protein